MFGHPFPLAIGRAAIHRVRRAAIIFGDVGQVRGLAAVHGPGTGQQEPPRPALPGKLQAPPRAGDDRIEHQQGFLLVQLGAGFRGGVNDMGETAVGEGEIAHVALVAGDGLIGGQSRCLEAERPPITRQDDGPAPMREFLVGPGETLQEPDAEEPRPAGDEDALAAQRFPQVRCVLEDVLPVVGG